jgi:HlyD family secretion protein
LKSKLFYLFIIATSTVLVFFTFSSKKRSNAIIASVESQKTAISFRKPVQVKTIHVSAGQHVSKGQILLEVERPDLLLEQEKLSNEKQLEQSIKNRLVADYQSKLKLLEIEVLGKTQRLAAEINRIETEIKHNNALYSNILAMTNRDAVTTTQIEQHTDHIQLTSYKDELILLRTYHASEKKRHAVLLSEDQQASMLRAKLIARKEEALRQEQATLIQYATIDGTIGHVSAQLMELIPPYQTIISVYEQLPSTIKAYVNLTTENGNVLSVGQTVSVESASRSYTSTGKVLEIGSRIVGYQDPSKPVDALPLFGKEVFIKLPENNSFLYGEQVFVYPPKN